MPVKSFLSTIGNSNVTGFWKISLNVTFYYSNIYNQNKERELLINLEVVTMCSSHLELPEIIGNTLLRKVAYLTNCPELQKYLLSYFTVCLLYYSLKILPAKLAGCSCLHKFRSSSLSKV